MSSRDRVRIVYRSGWSSRWVWFPVESTRPILDRFSTASRSILDRFPIASRPLRFSTYNPKCLTCQTFCPSAAERVRPPRPLPTTHADLARPVPDHLDLYSSKLPDRTGPLPDRYSIVTRLCTRLLPDINSIVHDHTRPYTRPFYRIEIG